MAEDKIKQSATKNLPSAEETQSSLDLLSMALAQTSRDPGLMAQVQLNIDRRMQAAREAEIEALRQVGQSQRTMLEQSAAETRSIRASQTQLQSTAMAQEGQNRRAAMEDATRRAIAGRESADRRAKLAQEQQGKTTELIQPILEDAQTAYVRLVTSGSTKDDPIARMIQAQAAPLLGKDKLTEQEKRTVAMAQAFSTGQGPIPPEQALEIVTNFMGARMAGLPLDARPLAERAFQAFAENFKLLDKGQMSPEEGVQVLGSSVQLMLGPEDIGPVGRFHLQNSMKTAWEVVENDPAARSAALEQVRNEVLRMGGTFLDDDAEMLEAMAQVNQVIADGLQYEDFQQLRKILEDLKVVPEAESVWQRGFNFLFTETPERAAKREAREESRKPSGRSLAERAEYERQRALGLEQRERTRQEISAKQQAEKQRKADERRREQEQREREMEEQSRQRYLRDQERKRQTERRGR